MILTVTLLCMQITVQHPWILERHRIL